MLVIEIKSSSSSSKGFLYNKFKIRLNTEVVMIYKPTDDFLAVKPISNIPGIACAHRRVVLFRASSVSITIHSTRVTNIGSYINKQYKIVL